MGLLGCRAPEPIAETAPPVPDPSAGSDVAAAEPAPEIEASEPAPTPREPASITVKATVKGMTAASTVRLLAEDGSAAAEGQGGDKLTVAAGTYTLEVQVTDETLLVDRPTKTSEVTLEAGRAIEQEVPFPWARIKLTVQVNGKPDSSALVRIFRKGAVAAEIRSGSDYVNVSPGRYKAQVKVRGAEIDVDEIMFPEGATREMPVPVAL